MKRNYGGFALVAMLCLSVLVGCGTNSGNGGNSAKLIGLAVTPTTATTTAGNTQTFVAKAGYSDGSTVDVSTIATWTSSNTAVATMNGPIATAVAAGSATITATYTGTAPATATLTVTAGPVLQKIVVTPANPTVANPGTQQFVATGTYLLADGSTDTQDITNQVSWASSKTTVATIDPAAGLATTVGPGTTTISATLGTVAPGTTVLTVTGGTVVVGLLVCTTSTTTCPATPPTNTIAAGSTLGYQAIEVLSDGTTQPLQNPSTLTWASGTTTTATVGATTGIAVAVGAGTSVITATEGALQGTANLAVQAALPRFAFNADSGATANLLTEWSVTASTGAFTSVTTTASVTQEQQILVHPSGHFLYGLDLVCNVVLYDINSTNGTVAADTTNGPYPTQTAGGTCKAAIDPTGSFLYLVNYGGSGSAGPGVYSFTINQGTGALTAIGTGPITANLTSPTDILIDKTGAYVYVVDNSNQINLYTINSTTGALTANATQASITTGLNSAFYGAIDPSNANLYVANSGDNTVAIYPITASNGTLGQPGTPTVVDTLTGAAILHLAIDPSGQYLYVDDANNFVLFGFLISNGTIGAATPSSPYTVAPLTTGPILWGITIDPTGTILGVNYNPSDGITAGTLYLYTLNQTTGKLTANSTNASETVGIGPSFLSFYSALSGQ